MTGRSTWKPEWLGWGSQGQPGNDGVGGVGGEQGFGAGLWRPNRDFVSSEKEMGRQRTE